MSIYEDDFITELLEAGLLDVDDMDEYDEPEPEEEEDIDERDTELDDGYFESLREDYSSEYDEPEDAGTSYSGNYGYDDYRGEFPDGPEGDAAYENWLDDIGD